MAISTTCVYVRDGRVLLIYPLLMCQEVLHVYTEQLACFSWVNQNL